MFRTPKTSVEKKRFGAAVHFIGLGLKYKVSYARTVFIIKIDLFLA